MTFLSLLPALIFSYFRMSRLDVREYLEKIYKLPVRDVKTQVVTGEITWNAPLDVDKRKALWKEEDRKFAYVYFSKNFVFDFPVLFGKDETETEMEKMKEFLKDDKTNERFVNRNRAGIGKWFGI